MNMRQINVFKREKYISSRFTGILEIVRSQKTSRHLIYIMLTLDKGFFIYEDKLKLTIIKNIDI